MNAPALPTNATARFHQALNKGRWAVATQWVKRGVSLSTPDPDPAISRYFYGPLYSWVHGVLCTGMTPEAQRTLDAFVARADFHAAFQHDPNQGLRRLVVEATRGRRHAMDALKTLLRCPLPEAVLRNPGATVEGIFNEMHPAAAAAATDVLNALAADRDGVWFSNIQPKSIFQGPYVRRTGGRFEDMPQAPLVDLFARAFSIILAAAPSSAALKETLQDHPELPEAMLRQALPLSRPSSVTRPRI